MTYRVNVRDNLDEYLDEERRRDGLKRAVAQEEMIRNEVVIAVQAGHVGINDEGVIDGGKWRGHWSISQHFGANRTYRCCICDDLIPAGEPFALCKQVNGVRMHIECLRAAKLSEALERVQFTPAQRLDRELDWDAV